MPLKEMLIPPEAEHMRVADFLRACFPDYPESLFRRVFSARDVKLDGMRVSRDQELKAGQLLKIYLPDTAPEISGSVMPDIVYEDEDVLLVNKRAGISVEKDARGGLTLTDLCAAYVRRKNPEASPPAACHRLDHQTSGLCLFARNPRALGILQDAFRNRTMDKYYICLVRGIMKPPAAICRAWLIKDAARAKVRISDREIPGSRLIVTGYETLEAGAVSRLRVHLLTGRTHQIRAHLAALGHPVLGDDLYGDRAFNKREKARSLKLCAVSLSVDTGGALPGLDGKTFIISPPF